VPREIASLLQQLSGRMNYPALLAAVDAGGAAAVTGARAQSNFHDQHDAAMEGDDVELAAMSSVITQHDLCAGGLQMRRCQIFGVAAQA